ncbi:thiamine diphosphokinase [Paenibacillus motobuensis]|uniref:thiamine diphosphokinase n=1 Tax=Paenibacillus TaxID=44249 RepID=UPI00203AD2B7|nr:MULTISPECIES: thiamine diphosphokinase [Paenibacillus]MCM3039232.1 thiamine diphosphokinase [Paenibacillus lutimineralis]MCM3646336.1 thiamine diphosphokinase [Paenibacillus motobuensis]
MAAQRVLIFAGGSIDPSFIEEIHLDDLIIGADRGALFLVEHGIRPHFSVGDFDSVSPIELENITKHSEQMLACDAINKDLTDTELAFDIAIKQRPDQIVMFGVTGSRLDHTLANIHLLVKSLEQHIPCAIRDHNNYVTLTDSSITIQDQGFTYVSLLPVTTEVTGIDLTGFQYPLHNATLIMGQSLAVSNRLEDKVGTITIRSGLLLIIQSKD